MILKIVYFGNGKDGIGGPMLHNINGFVIKKVWMILLGGCLIVRNQWVFSEIIKKFINSVTINQYMEDRLETCICQRGF